MKKSTKNKLLWITLMTIILIVPSIFALNTNIKTLPNKPFMYWITVTIPEKIDLFFTFNAQEKLTKQTLLAEKRLNEIKKLAQVNQQAVSEKVIKSYTKSLEIVEKEINKGVINSEELRNDIENILERVKEGEEEVSNLIPLPVVIDKDSCGGIQGLKCKEGYRCTCDFSQSCKNDQFGKCVKNKAEEIKEKIFCAMIYNPVCGEDGNTYSNECVAKQRGITKFKKGECSDDEKKECKEVCLNIGTISEGKYDSCSRKLIVLERCNKLQDQKPIENPNPEPPPETCDSDKICQDKYRNCYFQCLNKVCADISTFVKLPDYPDCGKIEPQPQIPEQCLNDKMCRDKLANCNAVCFEKKCIIKDTFKIMGGYPDCGKYGIL